MSETIPLFVILAGGEGKRFAPLVTNKTMFPFMDKPLLFHQLTQLKNVGVKNVLVATNSSNHDYLSSLKIDGINIMTKRQPKPLGMADSILSLKDEINDQGIFIMNAVDIVSDDLYKTILDKIATDNPQGLITGIKVDSYFPGGYIQTDGDKAIGVIEKPGAGNEPSDMVNLVFHYFAQPKNFIKYLGEISDKNDDAYEQAMSKVMQEEDFGFVKYSSYWHKLKYPHFVLDVMDIFLEHYVESYIDPTANISENAVIEGIVFIDKNVKVEAGAVIKGPSYIGPNTIIGNHALVRQSMIEGGSIVGFGSEVARSYVGPKCMLHHNFIGDSVLEAEINPSFGTVTTNIRLDGKTIRLKTKNNITGKIDAIDSHREKLGTIMAKGVFCGVNCSFMPGISLGENAKIYPHSVVNKAIGKNETYK